jgi:superfamily I DNA/RNA helicase
MAQVLNLAQQDAVTANGNILCCACPGSGKTSVLVAKVSHVLTSVPQSCIILTTFSRDAALGMKERITEVLRKECREGQAAQLIVGTFHSLAMRQLKEAGMPIRILSPIEVKHVIRRAASICRTDMPPDEFEAAIYACKADATYAARFPKRAALTREYQKQMTERGAVDFADLLLQANERMAAGTLTPLTATHVFADEMQDIDAVQSRWLGFHIAGNRTVCAVGDDDQSIYGFRAALGYRGMMDFQANTGARIINLDINYRSTAGIVASAERLISTNMDRVPKRLQAHRGAGLVPTVIQTAAGEPQETALINSLDRLCASNELPPQGKHPKPYRFGVQRGQIAVLARTNYQLDTLERFFCEHRVPYTRTGSSFWDHSAAQTYLSLLQGLHARECTGIEVALRWAGVTDHRLRALTKAYAGDLFGIFDGGRLRVECGPAADAFTHFGATWLERLSGQPNNYAINGVIGGVRDWMLSVTQETCGVDEATARKEHKPRLRDEWILNAVHDSLEDLKGPIPARIIVARIEGEQHIPRVIVSTFHASKGLEWDHVFLIDVATGSVPKIDDSGSDADLEEERRVFYVAMTRARDSLTIFTRPEPEAMSEFLFDAGLINVAEQTYSP